MAMFQATSFNPQTLALMRRVLDEAVETLPYPVSSGHVQALARNIIDLASQGERDPQLMKLLALLALRSKT